MRAAPALPDRLQLKRVKGFRLPAGAISVARPTPLGNPFIVGRHGTRAECVRKFLYLAGGLVAGGGGEPAPREQLDYLQLLLRTDTLPRLKGHALACWCRLPEPGAPDLCHAYVLLVLANEAPPHASLDALAEAVRPSLCEAMP